MIYCTQCLFPHFNYFSIFSQMLLDNYIVAITCTVSVCESLLSIGLESQFDLLSGGVLIF